MANDYYDFNPSATTWALLLTGFVLFVVALSVLLIYMIARSEDASVGRPHLVRPDGKADVKAGAAASVNTAQQVRPPRWSAATHGHA
jgi:hypothetical protein